jgi:hypothetical protein
MPVTDEEYARKCDELWKLHLRSPGIVKPAIVKTLRTKTHPMSQWTKVCMEHHRLFAEAKP